MFESVWMYKPQRSSNWRFPIGETSEQLLCFKIKWHDICSTSDIIVLVQEWRTNRFTKRITLAEGVP